MTAYLRPRDLDEATVARAAYPEWMVLAGGTDLMVNANHRATPTGILDLWRLPALQGITATPDTLVIGAGVTWLEVERHPAILETWAPLAAAAREIGALQIQARATLGGNVGTSSPVGDSLPAFGFAQHDETVRLAENVPFNAMHGRVTSIEFVRGSSEHSPAGAVANAYHPASSRGAGLTFETFGITVGGNIAGNLFREFVLRGLVPSVPSAANGKH